MSGLEGQGSGDHSRQFVLRDFSVGAHEDDELGHYHADVFGFVEEVDDDATGLATKVYGALPQPRNWLRHESTDPILGSEGLVDRRASVALIADDLHAYEFELDPEGNPLVNDWDFEQRSTRIVDYNSEDADGRGRAALLSQLVKVVDDHTQQYAPALVLGRVHPAERGGVVGAGLVYDDAAHGPFNALLDTFWTTNPEDVFGFGRESTPFGILGMRHDAHVEMEDAEHHGRIRFEPVELDGYSEPAGWPLKFKSELRSDKSTANSYSSNGHEANEWRPFYEATFFVPEIPPPPITDGPGVPVYPPDDPGVPVPGDGTGVTLALPLMDPVAPNTPPTDDGFGYLGLAENADGNVQIYVARGGATGWVDLCEQCCDGCGGGGTTTFELGGDGSDGGTTIVDGSSGTGMSAGTGPFFTQIRTILAS